MLWKLFGLGAVVLPVLGVGWALAAFERLGRLSWGRAAALGAGLILLVPYGIAIGIGPVFPYDHSQWSATQKLVGLFPAFLTNGMQRATSPRRPSKKWAAAWSRRSRRSASARRSFTRPSAPSSPGTSSSRGGE